MQFSTFTKFILSAIVTAPAVFVSAIPTATSPPAAEASASSLPTATATFSDFYEDGSASLDTVACSNGPNGLEDRGFTTLGSLPAFPYVGGTHFVSGWNSPQCGSCWKIQYQDSYVFMLAVDTSGSGFALSRDAFQELTNGEGVAKGTVEVSYEQVDGWHCGV